MKGYTILAASLLAFGMMQSASADNQQTDEASADQPMSLEALAGAFGWDLAGAQITSEKVADGLYVLFGVGGNIGVSIGSDGVLIVDDQFPQVMEKIEAAIGEIGGDGVDYAINTIGILIMPKATTPRSRRHDYRRRNARADMAKGGLVNLVIAVQQQPYPKAACRC